MGDVSDLGLMQLADSFFPTGLYTMSHGLEVLYLQKRVIGQEQIRDLIEMYFLQQVGPADCVALANAYSFAEQGDMDGIFKVDDTIHKLKLVKSQRDASTRSGKQLIKCITSFLKDESLTKYSLAVQSYHTPGTYPVSFALSAKSFGIPKRQACLMLFYGFAVSIVGAALRLGILQHFESQQILDEIKPTISKTIDKYITKHYEQMWQFAPQADVIQINHEKMYSKMFIT